MKIIDTEIPEIKILTPHVFEDKRGFFFESFNQNIFSKVISDTYTFVQDNHSHSVNNVLRGLHYQLIKPQAKLIRVIQGEIFDIAVDIRKNSKTFGKWVGRYLSSTNKYQMWIPVGFAHGFYVTSESADICYKTTEFYHSSDERCIKWNDHNLNIDWPIENDQQPIISASDKNGTSFSKAEYYP